MGLSIRRAVLGDVSSIKRIESEYLLADLDVERAERGGFLVSGFSEGVYRHFVDSADFFYVATIDDEPAGFLLAYSRDRIQPDEWLNWRLRERHPDPFVLIKQICVAQRFSSRGIASQLYELIIEQGGELPLFAAVVIDPPNARSIHFHERHGFREVARATPPDGLLRSLWGRNLDPAIRTIDLTEEGQENGEGERR